MPETTTCTINRMEFTDALECGGVTEYEIRDDYSGRGMNGADCFGITVSPSDERRVYYALGVAFGYAEGGDAEDMGPWERLMDRASVDSMGRDVIVYFPGFALEG